MSEIGRSETATERWRAEKERLRLRYRDLRRQADEAETAFYDHLDAMPDDAKSQA